MPPRRRRSRTPGPAEQHAEWLGLLRADGPFLALPVLTEVFGQGLDAVPDAAYTRARQAWTEVAEDPDVLNPGWQQFVLTELLGYRDAELTSPASGAEYRGPAPDAMISGPVPEGGTAPRLYLYRRGFDEPVTSAVRGEPALVERVGQVCRDTGVPLALVTTGRLWVLVHARPGEASTLATFDADLWFEEPVLLRAFVALLRAARVVPPPTEGTGAPSESLAGLFERSTRAQAQVTSTLGLQVRQAVELFVDEIARLDRESGGRLLAGVGEREIYRAGLTVLMRLVFLLYAEEQRLLPVADDVYASAYAVSTLYDSLEAERTLHGDEIGDRRRAAWPRLLALFRAVHGGSEHPELRIPAHGGSLFDPTAFPWLTRAAVTDRVIREILDALLMLKHPGRAPERLSYRGLDVEQIGHVYEGLLEFSCLRITEPYLGLRGKHEPEVALAEVEAVATRGKDRLHHWLRETTGRTDRQLDTALAAEPTVDQMGALHAACDNDAALAERIRPYWGLLRPDLRGEPTVFPAGSVLFTQVGDRRATGTHYTPRSLAEEVVAHTLAPLCHRPGPAEGAAEDEWQVKPAEELLNLTVVDPAMGSGAFLVSACRYLAERIVRAWERDGVPDDVADLLNGGEDRDGLLLAARRLVAARCLYGVDRDDMAVELAKLSLWLVTLATNKPFGFLDHALRCGDSLVGLVRTEQMVAFHLDPRRGWSVGTDLFRELNDTIDSVLTTATDLRRRIESSVVQDQVQAAEKAELLRRADATTDRLRLAADAVVGAALSTAVRNPTENTKPGDKALDDRLLGIAGDMQEYLRERTPDTGEAGESAAETALRQLIDEWLRGTRPTQVRPFHWPLEFPEVMTRGGFDAVVGNPPFIGGQWLTGSIGRDMREYLVQWLAKKKRGSADLCSYFLLRDIDIAFNGRIGIIATNTIAQGHTREVGLDQVVRTEQRPIYRAVKSQPWPGTASLYVSLIWTGDLGEHEQPVLDGHEVQAITPSLDSRTSPDDPYQLIQNRGKAFLGSNILGRGFLLTPEHAHELISKNPKNKDVLFPYLSGKDLNTRPDCSASQWVINFHDWDEQTAAQYGDCFKLVKDKVKPEREKNRRKARRERWWQFAERAPRLYDAITDLDQVLAIARVSSTACAVFVPARQVINEKVVAFATDQTSVFTLMSSSFHTSWAWRYSGTLKADLQYAPSDCFETFPQSRLTDRMDKVGAELHEFRQSVMLERSLGLTSLYNRVHDHTDRDPDIERLREIHVEVDRAVAAAYGWDDLDLGHGFHQTHQGERFTIEPDVRDEVLDRLLELNHTRYQEEVAKGPHNRKRRKKTGRSAKSRSAADSDEHDPPVIDGGLFAPDDALF